MNEKIKCKKCNLEYDSDLPYCPYCGFEKEDVVQDVVQNVDANNNVTIVQSQTTKEKMFAFPPRDMKLNYVKQLILFVLGFIGISIIASFFQLITKYTNPYFLTTNDFSAAINFGGYLFLFGAMMLVLNVDSTVLFSEFKNKRVITYGISYGFLLIVASSLVTQFFYLFQQDVTSNVNEQAIDSITSIYPILSLLIFGIIGPICEEITYRVGLFSFVRKYNRILAYVVVCLVFGLIHFDFSSFGNTSALINELINIPSYITAGLLLSYFYEKEGIATSIIAHVINNAVSILLTILVSF